MKTAIVNFSFDDGRIDNYTIAYPILKKYGFSATFNITMGYVEGKFEQGKLTPAAPMTIDMVKELYSDQSMEIAAHGYWHNNDLDDILEGVICLRNHLGIRNMSGVNSFASPGTGLSIDNYHRIKTKLNDNGIFCVRFSHRFIKRKRLKILMRRIARVLHHSFFYKFAYKDTLMNNVEDGVLYSIPILSSVTVSEIKSIISLAIKKEAACILMWHSIVEDGNTRDNWDYEVSKFEDLCRWLSAKQREGALKVETTTSLYNCLNKR